jgi:site-specific DNA recombinase
VRAALYKRVSTSTQVDGASLEIQDEKLRAYCTLQSLEIVEIYEDAGLSGKNIDRPAFKQMMKDAQDKKFDTIVIYKLDRLTRSVKDFHELAEKLDRLNISLVSVTQNLDTSTPVGRLLRNVLVDFANFEREMIVERVMDSKYSLAEKGQWLGGTAPFGYKVEDKKLILIPEQAEVVKQIYDDYLKGLSIRKLMNKYGLNMFTITYVLRNPVYTGMIGYSKTEQTNGNSKQRKHYDDWILAQGEHAAVIDKETFWKVQEIKKNNERKPGSRVDFQILSNLCYCECGNKLYYYYNSDKKKGYVYRYYRCNNYNDMEVNKGCRKSFTEEYIIDRVIKRVFALSSEKMEKYWDKIESGINTNLKINHDASIKKLESELSKNKMAIATLLNHLSTEFGQEIATTLMKQIKNIEKRNFEISKELDAKRCEENKMINISRTKEIIKNISIAWNNATREEKFEMIHILIKKIVVGENKIIFTINDPNIPEQIC